MTTLFSIDQSFTHLALRREQVLVVVHSINAVTVKVAELPPSPAMGYFVAWDTGRGQAAALIHLWYTELGRAVVYVYEPRAFPITALPQVTDEAWQFLESMGFMLDDAGYGTRRPEEQVALLERLPLFQRPATPPQPQPAAAPATSEPRPSPRAEAVGRLLMSF